MASASGIRRLGYNAGGATNDDAAIAAAGLPFQFRLVGIFRLHKDNLTSMRDTWLPLLQKRASTLKV